ncbi:kynureninase [Flavipsychrobacter stenotrophus]|uniref:Kynureninase n=1 Tax=Flavipsychrobacter stenotrophus TaxID=2077091 RepID=A0A2S7SRQ9_9BACT|nr:kynureninase [Flavipsychrobacter stenotrophus]PQJ09297.1 kynureninase [Flavipsychrobacter stenotrophus]
MSSFEASLEYAQGLDQTDILFPFRERFHFPQHEGRDVYYFCGNSLGLQPKMVSYLMQKELEDWAKHGVEGHFNAAMPWLSYHKFFAERLAKIVGAVKDEVVAMNTLTVNLHLLLLSFYRPQNGRYKILMEAGAFPSDQYAMETQVRMHGFDPYDAIIEIAPREGAHTIEESDILDAIAHAGDSLAVVIMGGVNYYTGQYFDINKITAAAHAVGAYAGFDLAHAVGNIPLHLHDWHVDFACWCSYKYLNSGPGGVGGVYVHEKYGNDPYFFRLAGWWGNEEKTRFKMQKGFIPQKGAASWQMSNAPVFNMVAHNASLDIFDKAGMKELQEKSRRLTGYLEFLLKKLTNLSFEIITPSDPEQRGCQLSMLFADRGREIFDTLTANGVIADWREPNVIRVAPVPLYNTFEDVYMLYEIMSSI